MRSTLFFLAMLIFVHCTTSDSTKDLESIPAFVEISSNPVSQAFFSAAAIRLKEEGRGGFQKVLALMNELVHGVRRQLKTNKRLHARSVAECTVTTHKLNDRRLFFAGQQKYFDRRVKSTINEQSEARTILSSRKNQKKSYSKLLIDATARYRRQMKKWGQRERNARIAVSKSYAALRAIVKSKKRASFVEIKNLVADAVKEYTNVKKLPLDVPEEMIQLSISDKKFRERLWQWTNLLRHSLIATVARAASAKAGIRRLFGAFRRSIKRVSRRLRKDGKHLKNALSNYDTLIKVYNQNEKIYSNLSAQNSLLITENKKYCDNDQATFKQVVATL